MNTFHHSLCWFTVLVSSLVVQTTAFSEPPSTKNQEQGTGAAAPFRPEPGKFPPVEKAHSYSGELVFVDHANRRGSLRVRGAGIFRLNDPHPFAMLPYGIVRYHGAPADLRDIPLGTVLHVKAFLPPDPKISAVPVLPVNSKELDANHNRGAGIFPAENHVLLLEDEPSLCLREGLVWKLKEVDLKNNAGLITATRGPKHSGDAGGKEEKLTFDAATRVWRGKECLRIADLIADGTWPESGRKPLGGQAVQVGITWKPTPGGVWNRFHLSDLWLDEAAIEQAARFQTETHTALIRSRWMPAWIDTVEYGKAGRATVTATFFGGMDASLYADFKPGGELVVNGAENTLKHTGGHYGVRHIASKGRILAVTQAGGQAPLGSSGFQVRFEVDTIIEAIRPKRVVRMAPGGWGEGYIPREEFIGDGTFGHEDRFPTPEIFPKYSLTVE
jgi:hypothetical protein